MRGTTKDARQAIFGARSWLGADRESVEDDEYQVRMWDGLTRAALEIDRLALLEQRLRAIIGQRREAGEHNARHAENSALPQTERNRLRGMAEAREVDYRLLSALLDPPTSREADEGNHEKRRSD